MARNIWKDLIRCMVVGGIIVLAIILVQTPNSVWLPGWQWLPEWMWHISFTSIIQFWFQWWVWAALIVGALLFLWRNL